MPVRHYKITVRSVQEAQQEFCSTVREILGSQISDLEFVDGRRRSDRKRRGNAGFWRCTFFGSAESQDVAQICDLFRNVDNMNYPRFKQA